MKKTSNLLAVLLVFSFISCSSSHSSNDSDMIPDEDIDLQDSETVDDVSAAYRRDKVRPSVFINSVHVSTGFDCIARLLDIHRLNREKQPVIGLLVGKKKCSESKKDKKCQKKSFHSMTPQRTFKNRNERVYKKLKFRQIFESAAAII